MIRVLLPLAIFLSAAAALAVELTIVKIGAPYVGQSLLPWSAAIASVLLGLTAGHVLGGMAAGHVAMLRQVWTRLAYSWLVAGMLGFAIPALLARLAPSFSGEGPGDALAIAVLAFPPSVAAGLVAPLAVRAVTLSPELPMPRMVAAIYAASAGGSVIGTAATGFILFEMAGSLLLMRLIGALWIGLGLCVLPWRRSKALAASLTALAAAVAVTTILTSGPNPCLRESRYTCIRLLDQKLADAGLLRFLILDEGVHSASDRDYPERLHLGYAALVDILAREAFQHSAGPRALVIGGGGATLPRAWSSSVEVTSVEIDAVVADTAKTDMWADRVTTRIGDGRAVLRGLPSSETFDAVLMDAYRTRSVPPHLVTAEFDALVSVRLRNAGVFLSNVIDRAENPLLALSIARTLSTLFPAVDIWVSDAAAGRTTNFVIAAWKDSTLAHRPAGESVTATVMEAGETPTSRRVVWTRIDAASAGKQWPGLCAATLTDDWAPVDRLLAGRSICRDTMAR